MIVGGTGLYIQSILYEYEFVEEDNALKKDILCKLEQYNKETLYAMLKDRDPKAAAQIHMNNRQRVLRALTYYEMHHKSITDQKKVRH